VRKNDAFSPYVVAIPLLFQRKKGSDGDSNLLYWIEPQTGRVLNTLPCPEVRTGLAFTGTHFWQIAGHPKRIRVIRPRDGEVEREISLGPQAESVCGLYAESDSYWTAP
jgi:hypothetical protein